jgi:DNA transformation protein
MRDGFVDHCLELLAPLGDVRALRMFGGHGLYIDELVDAGSRQRFADAGCEPFVYDAKSKSVTMSYWSAPPQALESPALMAPWARLAVAAALQARAVRKPPSRAGRTARAPATAAATTAAMSRSPPTKTSKRR